MNFKEIIYNSPEYHNSLKLRYEILRKPLGLDFSEEFLSDEINNFHLGVFEKEQIIAVVLLKPIDNKIIKMRQFAVDSQFQGLGIGRKLTEFSEQFAREKKFQQIILHARKTAVGFYIKLGYTIVDEEFIEVGIPHFKMQKKIDNF
jgi:predicted GNAT family N-acyltransferase